MFFEEKHSRQNYTTMLHYQNMHTLPHCQSSAEILFVLHGAVRALCRHQSMRIEAGECIWVMPYEVHSYETIEENDVAVYIFSTDLMPDLFQYIQGKYLIRPIIPFLPGTADRLENRNGDVFIRKAVLYEMASRVLQYGLARTEDSDNLEPMSKMMLYIQSRYQENISLRSLAQYMGYSYNYASRLFRQFFSMGFCEIVSQYRLEKATRLLKDRQLSVTEVASQSGFSTIRSFNMVFKQYYQMSPSHYRQNLFRREQEQSTG